MKTNDDDEILIEEEQEEDEFPIKYDIATYPSDFTLWGIYEMWESKDIIIPEFQREFVWSIRQASLLVESFLLGLPVPPVFFYVDEENKNQVIDGQQRILSICFYFEGFFGFETLHGRRQVFRLHGLDERSPYYKKKFDDLDNTEQRKLKNSVLRAINVRQLSPSDENTSIYHIFERLNTGGTALTPQEIRNCVFRGNLVRLLRELNADQNWRFIMGKNTFDKHQKDVELILRILALSKKSSEYEKPMKEFLNKAMSKERKGDSQKIKIFSELFIKTAKLIIDGLGKKPFHIRGPLNTSVLDSVFCTLLDNNSKVPSDLKNRFHNLLADENYDRLTYIGTTDTNVLKDRFKKAYSYLIGN